MTTRLATTAAALFLALGLRAEDGATPAAKDAPPVPAIAAEKGKVFRHPIGFSFWHPAAWTVKDLDECLQLLPPDPKSNDDGPTELYLIIGENVAGEGIQSPADPKVGAYLDEQLQAVAPFLARKGGTGSLDMTRGKGAIYDWAGSNPKGNAVLARAFVGVFDDNAVALVALALKEPLAAREETLRKMAASFGFGKGQLDAQLARTWTFVSNHALSNTSPFETAWSRAQLASEKTATLTLGADGTWTRVTKSHTLVGAGGVWLEDKSEKKSQGRWNAGDGKLYLMYDDDSWTIYQYRLEGNTLRLVCGKQGETWEAR